MKITASLNGVKSTKQIPITWDEVTFKQFLDLSKIGPDDAGILAYFFNIDKETVKKAKIKNLDSVINALQFLKKDIDYKNLPSAILGYDIPQNLEFETIGQYEDIKAELAKVKDGKEIDVLSLYPLFVATYAMKPYDGLKVDEFAEQFFNAPCGEVLAVGNFTLMKLSGLRKPSKITRLREAIQRMKLVQVIKSWRSNLAFTLRFSSWKHRHNIKETN